MDDMPVFLGIVRKNNEGEPPFWSLNAVSSPADITDSTGAFTITNIAVREYVLVVGDLYSKNQTIRDPTDDNNVRVYAIPADEVFDMGEVRVDPSRVNR